MNKTSLATGLTLTLCATNLRAEPVYDLPEITVTANQTETDAARSGTTVEVVTAQELNQAPETRLIDTLTTLPGVSQSSNGGLGTSANIRIRGLGGSYVPVLIDGIDVTDPASSGNGFAWGGVTSLGYGRVEVLKGSQSARFGMGAIGGVINLQTTRATQDGTHVQSVLEYGSFNTRKASYGVTSRSERAELALTFSHVQTDGFSANSAGTEDDGYKSNQLNFFAAYDVSDNFRIGINGFVGKSEGEFDEWGGDGALPYDETNESTIKGLRLFADFTTGAVDHKIALSTYETDRTSSSNGFDTPFNGKRQKFEYLGSYQANDRYTLNFGVDHMREETTGASADNTGVFGEALIAPSDAVDIALSLRHDEHSDFGGFNSARVALSWRIQPDLILRASASNGFRAPTLYQLTSVYGDATFQPETSTSFDLGLEKQFGAGFVKATLFHTNIDNQIFFDGGSTRCTSGFGCYEVQDFTSKGVELSGAYDITDRVTLTGNYTYTDAQDATGAQALRVPKHDFELGLDAAITDRLTMGVSLNHVADRTDTVGAVPDYTVVNLGATYDLNDNAQVYLRVENLTDEGYETAAGYSTSGRAAYFGLRANF